MAENQEFASVTVEPGMSMTVQRRVILEELKRGNGHYTADEILTMTKKRWAEMGLATVYRNLNVLMEFGLVTSVNFGQEHCLYEIAKGPHYHIICRRCGTIEDLKDVMIDELNVQIARLTRYQVTDHQLEVFGLCPSCKVKKVSIKNLESHRA